MDGTTPPARSGPDGPGDGAVHGVDAFGDAALDDWDRFFADVPDDLVFECIIENHQLAGGISVFRDRVVLCDPSPDEPTVASLERITGWGLVDDDTEVLVSIEADRPLRTRLPQSFHKAISHALMTTLGDSRHVR